MGILCGIGIAPHEGDAGVVRLGLFEARVEQDALEIDMRHLFGRSIVVVCDVLLFLLGKSGARISPSTG